MLANEMKKMRQLPAFSTSRWDSFFYFFFLPLDILETCVSYEEKENSRVNFFFNRSYFGACFSIFTLTV